MDSMKRKWSDVVQIGESLDSNQLVIEEPNHLRSECSLCGKGGQAEPDQCNILANPTNVDIFRLLIQQSIELSEFAKNLNSILDIVKDIRMVLNLIYDGNNEAGTRRSNDKLSQNSSPKEKAESDAIVEQFGERPHRNNETQELCTMPELDFINIERNIKDQIVKNGLAKLFNWVETNRFFRN